MTQNEYRAAVLFLILIALALAGCADSEKARWYAIQYQLVKFQ